MGYPLLTYYGRLPFRKTAECSRFVEQCHQVAHRASSMATSVKQEIDNFHRTCSIILYLCPEVLRDVLSTYVPPTACPKVINVKGTTYTPLQQKIVNDISTINSYEKCNISLLYILYRNIVKGIKFKPTGNWGKPPLATSVDVADDVERIRNHRNHLGHTTNDRISTPDYNSFITDMTNIMNRMDNHILTK